MDFFRWPNSELCCRSAALSPTHAATAKSVPGAAVSTGTERGPVDQGDVVDADGGLGGEDFTRGSEERFGAALALGDQRLDVADGAAEREGLGAFGGAEIGVARAEREAVGVADDGADDDFRPRRRSATMRRRTATWAASFWPKKARSGSAAMSSLATTVATPRKWPGRDAPSRRLLRPGTSTNVESAPLG